jgi:hypothetical protein
MALLSSKGGASLNIDQLPTKPNDLDGDGLPELCDAWQQPLAFFRFPYANAKLVTVAPNLTNQQKKSYTNPFDPMNTLLSAGWAGANRTTFEARVSYSIASGAYSFRPAGTLSWTCSFRT